MMKPIEEHKALVEAMVKRTPSLGATLIRTEGIFSKAKNHQHLNALVAKLGAEERELLAQMLEQEKRDGIFEALVHLSEACALEGLKLVKDGEEIPSEPFGYTLFEEYIGLLQADGDWSAMEG
jgi:hypothetical protein